MLLFCRQPWQLRTDSQGFYLLLICDNRYYEKVGSEVKDITDEVPFEIPDSWAWIRLGYIVDFSQSDTVAASQINPFSWALDLEDIEKDSGKLLQRKTFGETQSKSDKHH